MKIKTFILSAAMLLAAGVFAADKLAVAEPVAKGGMKAEEIEAFWGMLETSVKSDEYKLITRGALKQMMTEIGLTTSSDLMNLNSSQKARLGQIETVKYILVSEIGKFGTRVNCTMKILDTSTGEIDQARVANLRVKNLDELADRTEAAVQKLLSDEKQLKKSAMLAPVLRISRAPAYLAEDFSSRLENCLISSGIRRFEMAKIPYHVKETGASGFRFIGNIEGNIHVVSAQTGGIAASIPFEERVNFRSLGRQMTRDWTMDDYGKYLIKTVIPSKIIPALLKTPELGAR